MSVKAGPVRFRFVACALPALAVVALGGCTSSEPQEAPAETTASALSSPVSNGAYVESGGKVRIETEDALAQATHAFTTVGSGHDWVSTLGLSGAALICADDNGTAWTTTGSLNSTTAGSPKLSYRINFATSGTYNVWMLLKAASGGQDSVHVGLDDTYRFTNTTLPVSTRFSWVNVGSISSVTAGLHTLNVWAREDGLTLDAIHLSVNTITVTPSTTFEEVGGRVRIEAEAALENSSNADWVDRGGHSWANRVAGVYGEALRCLPDNGGLWSDNATAATSSPELNYKVKFNSAGTYKVWLLASVAADNKGSGIHFGLNGTRTGGRGANAMLNDGNGSNFEWVYVGDLSVPSAANHIVNFWAVEDGLTLDAFYLTTGNEMPRLHPEDGYELWMRYRKVTDATTLTSYTSAVKQLVMGSNSATAGTPAASAREELLNGFAGLLGASVPFVTASGTTVSQPSVVVGTKTSNSVINGLGATFHAELDAQGDEGFILRGFTINGHACVVVASRSDKGALYGAFRLLAMMQRHESLAGLSLVEKPRYTVRALNDWGGSHGGIFIFNKWRELPPASGGTGYIHPKYKDYARALASVGINGVIWGVGGRHEQLEPASLDKLATLAGLLRAYNIRFGLAVPFAAPDCITAPCSPISTLTTADPRVPAVQAWWNAKTAEIYGYIPDFLGYQIKADSEGVVGPEDYGATVVDGANMLALALRPHGGIVLWRTFVYGGDVALLNEPDRAKHAYMYFGPHDGDFEPEVILQTKHGPIDFQPREPVSPIIARMVNTNVGLELEIHQEYTGENKHLYYLLPQWRDVYSWDMDAAGAVDILVRDRLAANPSGRSSVVGVANSGSDINWTGHPMAAANWYGFGRQTWNPAVNPATVAEEWARMTYGNDATLVSRVRDLLVNSRPIYEKATLAYAPGVVINGGDHQLNLPGRQSQYHKADSTGVGYNRSTTGTGYASQYEPDWAGKYSNITTCPENYLLWFHHVPYTRTLSNGKTLIQEIYDNHFDAVTSVNSAITSWKSLQQLVHGIPFDDVLERMNVQLSETTTWKTHANNYFYDLSRIADGQGRTVNTPVACTPTVCN